jgi:hypothetical protein
MLDVMSRLQDVLRGSPIHVDGAFIFEGGDFSLNTLLQLQRDKHIVRDDKKQKRMKRTID